MQLKLTALHVLQAPSFKSGCNSALSVVLIALHALDPPPAPNAASTSYSEMVLALVAALSMPQETVWRRRVHQVNTGQALSVHRVLQSPVIVVRAPPWQVNAILAPVRLCLLLILLAFAHKVSSSMGLLVWLLLTARLGSTETLRILANLAAQIAALVKMWPGSVLRAQLVCFQIQPIPKTAPIVLTRLVLLALQLLASVLLSVRPDWFLLIPRQRLQLIGGHGASLHQSRIKVIVVVVGPSRLSRILSQPLRSRLVNYSSTQSNTWLRAILPKVDATEDGHLMHFLLLRERAPFWARTTHTQVALLVWQNLA